MRRYRENTSASTLERVHATKSQLELRYTLIFDALAKHEAPPNLLSVIRWRRNVSTTRRRDGGHLAMTELVDVPRENATHAAGSASPGVAIAHSEPTNYASEAASLQWLPHLASLHSRFLHPSGRKDMKEWHVTAQVLKDYASHGDTPIVRNQPLSASPANRSAHSTASSPPPLPSSRGRGSRGASLEMQRPDPATELERFSSLEHESNDGRGRRTKGAVSPSTSVKGYRLTLTGLGAMRNPRRVFSKSSRPTSPSEGHLASPVHATEISFSPSSSRGDLSRKPAGIPLGGEPLSSEISMSEGVTDADDLFQRGETSRRDLQTASEEDWLLRTDGNTSKPRWTSPIFARKNSENRLAVLESASSPATGPEEATEDSRRPVRETQSFTADFLYQFPRVDEHLVPLRWEETQRIQRDHYARQEV